MKKNTRSDKLLKRIPFFEKMASRSDFKDKIIEKLAGALGEFITARTFTFNGETKWVQHKLREVRDLLHGLTAISFLSKSGNWDMTKAAGEAKAHVLSKFPSALTVGRNNMVRYFHRASKKVPDVKAAEWQAEFESMVDDAFSVFEPDGGDP